MVKRIIDDPAKRLEYLAKQFPGVARLLDLLRKCRDYICQIPPGSYPRIDEQKHGEFIAEITTALELERGIE